MKKIIIIAIALLATTGIFAKAPQTLHSFTVDDIDGNQQNLAEYDGKVVLVVNVASKCGFTSQYESLQKLYEDYSEKGVEILGFPCNQFNKQEPGSESDIKAFCTQKYGVTFPMFSKIKVNGDDAAELYKFLKKNGPVEEVRESEKEHRLFSLMEERIAPREVGSEEIRWNFTKFLVDENGKVVKRFEPTVSIDDIKTEVDRLLD